MALQKNLRIALVTVGLFSAAMAGHAQVQPQNIQKLVSAPVAQQAVATPDLASTAKTLLAHSSDKASIQMLAPQLKMAPDLMAFSMDKAVFLLKMHLKPAEQQTALQGMLASSLDQKEAAQALFKQLPQGNVITQAMAGVYENQQLLGSKADWSEFNQALWKAPKFNVQQTLAEPGVKSLQSLLENKCAIPQTSFSLLDTNTSCAMKGAASSKSVVASMGEGGLTDGLLVGEYEGIPVMVMHDPAGAQGPAAVYRLKDEGGKEGSPFIAVTLELLDKLQNNPDTLAFIMEHELGHVEHNHVMGNEIQHELDADQVAVRKLGDKGMSPERIAKAYQTFEQKFSEFLPSQVLKDPGFISMMQARHTNVEQAVRMPHRHTHVAQLGHGS